ncbi:hypothetical protein B0H14DRAFT_2619425 [Mycena olivaceomarginata]|nr:hypothetical protein B0H14DRAFT_2619425 [Mycena olivaceomarginata]
MLDATLLTSPRWMRAPLLCSRCGVPARVDAASSIWQYPSTADPTDIAYFLVVVHLRDGHDSTTLAWLVASTLRLPSYPRLHLRHGFTATIGTSLPYLGIAACLQHASLTPASSASCPAHLGLLWVVQTPVLGVVYLADDYDTPGARSALILAAALSLHVDLHTRSTSASRSIAATSTPVRAPNPAAAPQPQKWRPQQQPARPLSSVPRDIRPSGPQTPIKTPAGERKVSCASQVKAEPQTKPLQGQGQMQPRPVPGPAADADDAGNDSFGFFLDDDAFLACVDVGEGDLGQPITITYDQERAKE